MLFTTIDLPALIATAKAATAPDREIDAAVYFMMHCAPSPDDFTFLGYHVTRDHPGWRPWSLRGGKELIPTDGTTAQRYTASVDAALLLRPPGYEIIIQDLPGSFSTALIRTSDQDDIVTFQGKAFNLATAILIACLELRHEDVLPEPDRFLTWDD